MEGELWKWTNYWNGWQSRWFILDQGILSYYKSLEEVEQGCKGSLNVSACEISLHPTDSLRLDLAIPGEQHMYVRANTEKARQQWLVALGSAKACLSNQKQTSPPVYSSAAEQSTRSKKAELRLYCDMLMQQVHNIKQTVQQTGGGVDLEKLHEDSYMLEQTCDTFITTLDDLMLLTQVGVGQGLATPVQNGVGGVDNRGRKHGSMERTCPGMVTSVGSQNRPRNRIASTDSMIGAISNLSTEERHISAKKSHSAGPSLNAKEDGFGALFGANHQGLPSSELKLDRKRIEEEDDVSSDPNYSPRYLTMDYSLPFQLYFPCPTGGSRTRIPTQEFLDASAEAITIFDLLDPKAFAPLKFDAVGHIQCLRTKLASDPSLFAANLEAIVTSELSGQQAANINSGSRALLWLVRNLTFVNVFLRRFIEMDPTAVSLEVCLAEAYEETLMEHHGLVVRSVFSVAMKCAPSRTSFLVALGLPSDEDIEEQKFFQAKIVPKLAAYLDTMERCLTVLVQLFKTTNIETTGN